MCFLGRTKKAREWISIYSLAGNFTIGRRKVGNQWNFLFENIRNISFVHFQIITLRKSNNLYRKISFKSIIRETRFPKRIPLIMPFLVSNLHHSKIISKISDNNSENNRWKDSLRQKYSDKWHNAFWDDVV